MKPTMQNITVRFYEAQEDIRWDVLPLLIEDEVEKKKALHMVSCPKWRPLTSYQDLRRFSCFKKSALRWYRKYIKMSSSNSEKLGSNTILLLENCIVLIKSFLSVLNINLVLKTLLAWNFNIFSCVQNRLEVKITCNIPNVVDCMAGIYKHFYQDS